jgi:hypothetical protein
MLHRSLPPRIWSPAVARGCSPVPAVLGVAAALLYAVSFFLPAYHAGVGYEAFVSAFVCVIGMPMWFANPVFWSGLGLLYQGKYAAAGRTGLRAVVLALSECWLFSEGLRVGYFAWVGSMALLAVAGWCGQERDWPHGLRGAGEASRIAARFVAKQVASRTPCLPSDQIESR